MSQSMTSISGTVSAQHDYQCLKPARVEMFEPSMKKNVSEPRWGKNVSEPSMRMNVL